MLKLEIVTPERKVFDGTVEMVTVPTTTGDVGILPNHAPLISAVKPGILSFQNRGAAERLAVAGGFVEVSGDSVYVLVDTAESAAEIDADAGHAEREAAESALAAATASIDETEDDSERLETANVRLQLIAGR